MSRVRRKKSKQESDVDKALQRGIDIGREQAHEALNDTFRKLKSTIAKQQEKYKAEAARMEQAAQHERDNYRKHIKQFQEEVDVLREKLIKRVAIQTENTDTDLLEVATPKATDPSPIEKQMEEFKAGKHREGGVDVRVTGQLQIGPRIYVNIKNNAVPEEKYHFIARMLQQAFECALKFKGGTIVTDPIVYRGDVGVFVKNGSAKDAAQYVADIAEKSTKRKGYSWL